MADLNTGVRFVKGIGEQRAKALEKLGIHTLRDLISWFPRRYEDRSETRRVADLIPGETACVAAMVAAVRHTEAALGSGRKAVSPSEAKNKPIARKSIVAARAIAAGEVFTEQNLTTKRPGSGVSPMRWHEVLGQTARRAFAEDEPIEL